jgi:gluconolactonase
MATDNAIRSFTLDVGELGWTGQDLQRPESGVAEPDGTLWVSDGRGGVMRIDPDGGQALLAGWGGEPNGLAIDPDGNLVTANIALGRVQRMTRDGQASTVLEEVDGQRTTSANFVFYDRQGRLWLTCLTREDHWWPAVADARPDGFIVLVDGRGARIVADGIYATNEARLDAEERYLYVAETMKARILRFPVRADGSLGEREVFGPDGLGRGGFVDGFSFDAEGNLWVTTVVRNGLGVLTRDGDWHVVVEDPMRTRSPPSSTGWRQARRCRTICWPAPARGCSSRPVVLRRPGPAHGVCGLAGHVAAANLPRSRPGSADAPLVLSHPSGAPRVPLLGQHRQRQLAAEQIICPNRQAGRGRTATAAPHSRSGRLVARRRSAAPARRRAAPGLCAHHLGTKT